MIRKIIRKNILRDNPKMIYRLVISLFILASAFNSCNSEKHLVKNNKGEIPDSIMHFIKINSSNKKLLKKNFSVKFKIYECHLKREQLLKIEKLVYNRISKDSLYLKTHFIDKFYETHRQYIMCREKSNSYLYIRYTYFANGKWNTLHWQQNKLRLDRYLDVWISPDLHQFSCLIPLSDMNNMGLMLYSL